MQVSDVLGQISYGGESVLRHFDNFKDSTISSGPKACIKSYLLAKTNKGTFNNSSSFNRESNSTPASFSLSLSAASIT